MRAVVACTQSPSSRGWRWATARSSSWLLVAVAATIVVSSAALFAMMLAPVELVYKTAFEAGRTASGCSQYRPILTQVLGSQQGASRTVTNIRTLHTDS